MASLLPFHRAEMVRALIDESRPAPRYETVYGELLVTPSPGLWHQELVDGARPAAGRALCAALTALTARPC
jgi:hypothetical protein